MNEQLFRKKSLDKIKSPENLDDYIRVSNPAVWLLLISVIVLLAGACVWGVFGQIDSTIPTTVRVEKGTATCYIAEEDISTVRTGFTVKFEDKDASIVEIGGKGEQGYACSLSPDSSLPDGIYEGKIIIKSYKPLSFVFN